MSVDIHSIVGPAGLAPALDRSLQEITTAHLVIPESPDELSFRHVLTREAVYSTLLLRQRKRYHRLVAETLEQLRSDSADAFEVDLAIHYAEAEVWDKALEFSRRAGERAQRMFAPREAVEHWTRALDAARQLPNSRVTDLLRARGHAFETLGEFERARADYEAFLSEARAAHDSAGEWQALIDLGFLWAARDYGRTGDYFQQALALARTLGDPRLLGHALNRVGNYCINVEQPREAEAHHRQALQVFERLEDKTGLAETNDLLGLVYMIQGDYRQGTVYVKRAIALFRELDDRRGLSSVLANYAERGILLYDHLAARRDDASGDPLADAEESVRIARDIGWRSGESYSLSVLGAIQGSRGDLRRGLESLELSLRIAEEIGHLQWMTIGQMSLGVVYGTALARERAESHLEQALAIARRINSALFIRQVAGCLASVYIQYGDEDHFSLAERELDAVGPADSDLQTFGEWFCGMARVELALARGQGEQALVGLDRLAGAHRRAAQGLYLSTLRAEALSLLHRFAQAEQVLMEARAADVPAAPLREWRYHRVLGLVLRQRRRFKDAAQEFQAAREGIERLAADIPDADMANTFRTRALAQIPRSARASAPPQV